MNSARSATDLRETYVSLKNDVVELSVFAAADWNSNRRLDWLRGVHAENPIQELVTCRVDGFGNIIPSRPGDAKKRNSRLRPRITAKHDDEQPEIAILPKRGICRVRMDSTVVFPVSNFSHELLWCFDSWHAAQAASQAIGTANQLLYEVGGLSIPGTTPEMLANQCARIGIGGIVAPHDEWSKGLVSLCQRFELAAFASGVGLERSFDAVRTCGISGVLVET